MTETRPWRDEKLKEWSELNKVAFMRTGTLGDLALGLAALWEMVLHFPNASIVVMGPKLWAQLLEPEEWPFVKELAVVDEGPEGSATIYKRSENKWKKDVVKPIVEIFRDCDGIVNTNMSPYRYGFLAMRAGVKIRVGSTPAPMAWLYTHASPFFGKDTVIHQRDAALLIFEFSDRSMVKYFRTLERNMANITDWVERSELVRKWREQGLPHAKQPDLERAAALTGREPGTYVVVNPTSPNRQQAWPSEKFRELLLATKAEFEGQGIEPVVVGAPGETEWLKEVAGDEFKIVQPEDLADLQDVLSGSRGLLSNTSTVQFIAAITGTPAVTLMPEPRPELGPVGPNDTVIVGQASAHEANDRETRERVGYESIPVEEVVPKFLELPNQPRVR